MLSAISPMAPGLQQGTFIGMAIEEKLSLGLTSVRIITKDDPSELMKYLRAHDYGVTSINGEGGTGPVKIGLYDHQTKRPQPRGLHHQGVPPQSILFGRRGQVRCRRGIPRTPPVRALWLDGKPPAPLGGQVTGKHPRFYFIYPPFPDFRGPVSLHRHTVPYGKPIG